MLLLPFTHRGPELRSDLPLFRVGDLVPGPTGARGSLLVELSQGSVHHEREQVCEALVGEHAQEEPRPLQLRGQRLPAPKNEREDLLVGCPASPQWGLPSHSKLITRNDRRQRSPKQHVLS